MTEKRFKMIITNADGSFHYLDEITGEKITSTLALEDKLNELAEENKELNEQLSVMTSNGLKVLEFYEDKLKNVDKKEFENAREELWIVKEVLCEMGVIKDD